MQSITTRCVKNYSSCLLGVEKILQNEVLAASVMKPTLFELIGPEKRVNKWERLERHLWKKLKILKREPTKLFFSDSRFSTLTSGWVPETTWEAPHVQNGRRLTVSATLKPGPKGPAGSGEQKPNLNSCYGLGQRAPLSSPMSRTDVNRLKGTVSQYFWSPLAACSNYRKPVCSKKANFLRLCVVTIVNDTSN